MRRGAKRRWPVVVVALAGVGVATVATAAPTTIIGGATAGKPPYA